MLKKFNSLSRRAGDEFFFDLLIDILNQLNNSINQDYDVFYIPVITEQQLIPIKHSKNSNNGIDIELRNDFNIYKIKIQNVLNDKPTHINLAGVSIKMI